MGMIGWIEWIGMAGKDWIDKELDGQQVQKLNYLEHELLTTLKKLIKQHHFKKCVQPWKRSQILMYSTVTWSAGTL